MKKRAIRIEAGERDRPASVVQLPLEIQATDPLMGVEVYADGQPVASELEHEGESGRCIVAFVLDALPAGSARTLELRLWDRSDGSTPAQTEAIAVTERAGAVDFLIGGELFTTYHYREDLARPCFHPVLALGGRSVTRSWPMDSTVEGDVKDHPHHRGLWVAHGEVNGVDNWSEGKNHAWTRHTRFERKRGGPVSGHLDARSTWQAPDGTELLEEARQATVYALPAGARILDLSVHLTAHAGAVTFGDTKEGGICSVRVATSMDGDHGGRIQDADGRVGERQAWGKRSRWCDYSGSVQGETVGITIMDHPENFRHPTYWHVRDYGLMTANPFGVSVFTGSKEENGAHTLAQGESLLFRYRVLVHPGGTKDADVAGHYANWVDPCRTELQL